jgi:CRISPR-associated protein Cas2
MRWMDNLTPIQRRENMKRMNKVFKVYIKYLNYYQNSVFRSEITPSNIIKLRNDLKGVIKKDYDFISIIKLIGSYNFDEEIIGTQGKDPEDIFL